MHKILVTRPSEDFARTATNLSASGFAALSAPMMDFVPLDFSTPNLQQVAGLIFTSANGLRAIKNNTELRKLPCYVVGEQTAKLAQEYGFTIYAQGQNNVSTLAAAIEQDYKQRGLSQALLHISGVHQAGNLSQILDDKQIKTSRLQAYEMREVDYLTDEIVAALEQNEVSAICFYSSRSAEIFLNNLQNIQKLTAVENIPVFCLSKTIAHRVCKPYLRHIYFVEQPNEAALIKLMQEKLN